MLTPPLLNPMSSRQCHISRQVSACFVRDDVHTLRPFFKSWSTIAQSVCTCSGGWLCVRACKMAHNSARRILFCTGNVAGIAPQAVTVSPPCMPATALPPWALFYMFFLTSRGNFMTLFLKTVFIYEAMRNVFLAVVSCFYSVLREHNGIRHIPLQASFSWASDGAIDRLRYSK